VRGDVVAIFLIVVGALVPWMAWKSRATLGAGPLPIPRREFYQQTIIMQLLLFALAIGAVWPERHALFRLPPSPLRAWGVAAALVAVLLLLVRWRWPSRDDGSKERLASLLPSERGDFIPYFILCGFAGVCEEAVYRGALAMLLTRFTGSVVAAALIASLVFAVAHVLQGPRSTIAIFFIGLGAHALVIYSDSLLPAMAAHAVYDAIAGVLMPRWSDRDKARTVAES
jgi:membrane protease YdiL (CAAX protease family)